MHEIDRVLDVLLAEELAGERPCDLSPGILEAAAMRTATPPGGLPSTDAAGGAASAHSPAPPAVKRRVGTGRSALAGVLLGTLAVGLPVGWCLAGLGRDEPVVVRERVVRGYVMRGSLTWQPVAGSTVTLSTNLVTPPDAYVQPLPFALAITPGDRLIASDDAPLRLAFENHGRLEFEPATCLEIRDVEWKPLTGGFVAGSITVTALVGSASWFGSGETTTAADESVVLAASGMDGAPGAASATAAAELAAARQRINELESMLVERTAVPVPSGIGEEPPESVVAAAAISTGSAFDTSLANVDWQEVGVAIDGYLTAQHQIEALRAAGEPVPMELRATADRHESALFEQIADTLEAGVPGSTVTAKIHHPAIGTNLFQAVMDAAGTPLDEAQRERFAEIGRRYTAEDAARRASYNDQTFDLERFVDENEMQHRCFGEQRSLLNPNQEARLSFGDLGDRTGIDPFGSSYQWSKNNRVIEVADRAALVRRAGQGYAKEFGLDDAQVARLRPMLERWVSRWPARWLDLPIDQLDRNGRMHLDRVRAAGRLQVELLREMAGGLGLSAEQLESLRRQRTVFVPFLQR